MSAGHSSEILQNTVVVAFVVVCVVHRVCVLICSAKLQFLGDDEHAEDEEEVPEDGEPDMDEKERDARDNSGGSCKEGITISLPANPFASVIILVSATM